MTSFDDGIGRLRVAAGHVVTAANALAGAGGYITGPWDRFTRWLRSVMPHGLYARALLIVIMPLVVLQSIVAFLFIERQSSVVNYYLSSAATREIAALIDVYKNLPPGANRAQLLRRIAQDRLGLVVDFLPGADLPPPGPKPFFSSLDQELSNEIRKQIGLPFWIDTVGRSSIVEIRIRLDDAVMRVFAPRAAAYNSNALIFLMWMVLTSVVVLTIAILFLRNQIKPIVRLADAAEAFGKGREVPNFRPRGAREVRRAAAAFLEMKTRIERAIEQRTTMLAGVSHDLRTPLTRMKLALALIGEDSAVAELKSDVAEMERLVNLYLDFARGEGTETIVATDIALLIEDVAAAAERQGAALTLARIDELVLPVRPNALRRCLSNLIANARHYGHRVWVSILPVEDGIDILIDDDGPGIPPAERERVFQPFIRLDTSRNPSTGGVGLGLTIARDVARSHGGDVRLETSPHGGLRARVHLPR